MKPRIIFIAFLLAHLSLSISTLPSLAGQLPPVRASFDCTNVSSRTEKAICGNWDFSFADRVQAMVCQSLIERLDETNRSILRKEQSDWLKERNQQYEMSYKSFEKGKKTRHQRELFELSFLRTINKRTSSLIAKLADLSPERLIPGGSSGLQWPQDYRRLFGTWKIIAVINDGVHDSGYPELAESFLGKEVRMNESLCPAKDRNMDQVDIFEWYGNGYRASAEEFGFKNYQNVMRITCSMSAIYPNYSNQEYLFFNDYLMSDGLNTWLRVEVSSKPQ